MNKLESRGGALEHERIALQGPIGTLRAVLGCLKEEVLRHTECGHEEVHTHLESEQSTDDNAVNERDQKTAPVYLVGT